VETVPREIRMQAVSSVSEAAARVPLAPAYTRVEPSTADRDSSVRLRLGLQQRAAANLRRHMVRAVRRFSALVVADLASFYLMRELMRALREVDALTVPLGSLLPRNILNGWQYAAALFVALFVTGNYGRGDQRRDPRRLFLACALATALPLWMTIWTRGLEPVIVQYAITTVLVWVGLVAERRAIDRVIEFVRPAYRNAAATLFVGPAEECRAAIESPGFAVGGECLPIGFVDVHVPPAADAIGHVSDFASLLNGAGAEVAVICGHLPDTHFREVVDAALASQCHVLSVPRAIAVAGVQPTLVWRREQPLIELTRPTLKAWQLFLKRVVDVVGSVAGLLLFSPVFTFVAVAVKLESHGPAIFGHQRLGLNARTFNCLKFRSMHPDAEERLRRDPSLHAEYVANHFKLAEARDPRLTLIGRFLRKTSLDELPQLINVLKGEMSLVGPRPIVPAELKLYGHGAPAFLSLKPGMTGAWQINGRSDVGYPHRADIELEYVQNWSLGGDLWILLKTIPAVLGRRGAH